MIGEAGLRVRLLGGVQIHVAGRPVEALSSRAVDLLALLASHVGTVQPRSHVAARLWPDSTETQARTNLRRELHHLRAILGDLPVLTNASEGLGWVVAEGVDVDVVTVLTAVADAVQALDAGDPAAFTRATAALPAVEPGEFLPGCHDEWVLEVREGLTRAVVDVCDRGTAFWRAHHDPEAALPLARLRVRLEPLEEIGYLRLLEAHRATGDVAGAVSTYHRCATLLERELGVGPGPALRSAMEDVLDEQSRPPGPARGSREERGPAGRMPDRPPVRGSRPPFIGRRDDLERLLADWEQAAGSRHLIVIVGEPGVGKTRLQTEFAALVRRRHGVVASARCHPGAAALPLAPVAEWLRAPQLRHAVRRLDPVWRAEVERLAPAQPEGPASGTRVAGTPAAAAAGRPRSGPTSGPAAGDAWQRIRFFEALARAVAGVSRPVLLTLDDLQWCDRATLAWLSFLLKSAIPSPVLVVATARRAELERSSLRQPLAAMAAAGHTRLDQLTELDADDMATLAAEILGREVDGAERALLRAATEGNPMSVIVAATQARAGSGRIRAEDLRTTLGRRLAALAPAELAIARLVSAAGRDVDLDLLMEASDLGEQELVAAVDGLWRSRLLVQERHRYDLAHDLIREAVYDEITPPQRWLLHRRVAQAMELAHDPADGPHAAALAEQYAAAGLPRRALPLLAQATHDAVVVFAHEDAIRLSERALQLLETQPRSRGRDERELATLLLMLPPLNALLGYASPRLEALAQQVALLAERLGRVADHTGALVTLFSCAFVQGRIAESAALGRQALELSVGAPDLRAQAHFAVAGAATSLADLDTAQVHFEEACALAAPHDALPNGTRTAIHAGGWWAHARYLRGDHDGAVELAHETVAAARLLEHPWSLTVALSYSAVTHQLCGDRAGLGAVLEELEPLCARYRFAYYDGWAAILRGWLSGAPERTRAGIDGLVAAGSLTRLPYWLWLHAEVCRSAGDRPAAAAALDPAIVQAHAHDDLWWLPVITRSRGEVG